MVLIPKMFPSVHANVPKACGIWKLLLLAFQLKNTKTLCVTDGSWGK
jgi:hypothetical protein